MAAKGPKTPGVKPSRAKKTGKSSTASKRRKPAARDKALLLEASAAEAAPTTQSDCPIVYHPRVQEPPKKRGASKRGRPFVCIGPVRRKMIEHAWLGLHRETIAVQAGVSYEAMRRLVKEAKAATAKKERGKRLSAWEDELCVFWVAFQQAEAGPLLAWTSIVTTCTDPKVVLEAMGRRYPRLWGKRTLMANAPEEDEDGQPLAKKGVLKVEADPLTLELIQAELAARGEKGTGLLKESLPPPKNPHLLQPKA